MKRLRSSPSSASSSPPPDVTQSLRLSWFTELDKLSITEFSKLNLGVQAFMFFQPLPQDRAEVTGSQKFFKSFSGWRPAGEQVPSFMDRLQKIAFCNQLPIKLLSPIVDFIPSDEKVFTDSFLKTLINGLVQLFRGAGRVNSRSNSYDLITKRVEEKLKMSSNFKRVFGARFLISNGDF